MIRHQRGDEFLLITQHDHALLSGKFATHVGNEDFAPPSPYREVVDGIALHDCGWPLHDDQRPTLNAQGLPLNVLESPMMTATKVWGESARRAAQVDSYSGLLVSLHVMGLSAIAQTNDATPHERARDRVEMFELHKFQHRQVEAQEDLRRQLGMRTDLPLHLGLARHGSAPEEDLLHFNFGLLKAMDRLSLDLCSGENLFPTLPGVHPRPGTQPLTIDVKHPGRGELAIRPWPFDVAKLEYEVPCRRLPAAKFDNEEAFRRAYAEAPLEAFRVRLSPA